MLLVALSPKILYMTILFFLHFFQSGSIEVSVSKQHLRETGSWNPNAIIPARVPSTLYCRSLRAGTDLYACLLLADEDVTVGRLNSISPLSEFFMQVFFGGKNTEPTQ